MYQISGQPTDSHMRQVSFKDLGWSETREFQALMRGAAVLKNFPAMEYTLVRAEFKAGDEDQRLDLLYLRNDGALLPCELKIGGKDRDTVGQLLRYVADLYFQTVDLEWLRRQHDQLVDTLGYTKGIDDIFRSDFHRFITENAIESRHVRFLPRAGVIIDEDFPSQLQKTIRYLNEYCGFSIRTWKVEVFVSSDCCIHPDLGSYLFRLDFISVD